MQLSLSKIWQDFLNFFLAPSPIVDAQREIEFLTSEIDYWRSRCNVLDVCLKNAEQIPTKNPKPEIVAYEGRTPKGEPWVTNKEPHNMFSKSEIEANGLTFRPLTYAD